VCTPRSDQIYHLAPWPFDQPELTFAVPSRHVPAAACADLVAYRAACAAAPFEALSIHLVS